MIPEQCKNIAIYNASRVTTELPGSLLCAIRNVFERPERVSVVNKINYNDEETLYIIICPAGLGSERKQEKPKYYITYQLEAIHVIHEREHYRDFLSGAIMNWDYSKKNVEILKEYGIPSMYVPPGFTYPMTTKELADGSYIYSDTGKDIDVLFLGWDVYERRKKIKEDLMRVGLKTVFVCDLDIEGMKKAIKRAKILLNLHFQDNMTCLETIRLNILLSNQACIVSEDIDDPEKDIYQDHITIVPYDRLVDTCITLIKDPEARKRQAIKSYRWYRKSREWNSIVDFCDLLR